MRQINLATNEKLVWVTLAVLFPLWGIGGLQLLVRAANELAVSNFTFSQDLFGTIVSFFFSLTLLAGGVVFSLREIWIQQSRKMSRLDLFMQNQQGSYSADHERVEQRDHQYEDEYDSERQASTSGGLSYTRVWYMSFQNHLIAKSGFDTMKLTPLKRWPAILRGGAWEDIVSVWDLPLILMVVGSVPAIALLIAGADRVFEMFVGASFCYGCYEFLHAISSLIASTFWYYSLPAVAFVTIASALTLGPAIVRSLKLYSSESRLREPERAENVYPQ